jgi:hypothetical protein
MSDIALGRLEKVELRKAWISEPGHFTPWLARPENLELLGEAIGIPLECEAQEKFVGPFRADILCRDAVANRWVLIENQLERTDHLHLGQLLTYAAGLEAVSIVWIAERFTDEHRAALDWLNQYTLEGINFFGLEVELWRIGDSALAPKFNVVCKPNEWTRSIASAASNSEAGQFYYEYWTAFLQQADLTSILKREQRPMRSMVMRLGVGWRGFYLNVFAGKMTGVYLMCRGANGGENYKRLFAQREQIEKELGAELTWTDQGDRGYASWRLPENEAGKREDWPRQHAMLAEKTLEFYRCFEPRVRLLEMDANCLPG